MRNEIATAPNSRFGLPELPIISTFQSTNGRDRNPTVGRVRVPGESTSHVLSSLLNRDSADDVVVRSEMALPQPLEESKRCRTSFVGA